MKRSFSIDIFKGLTFFLLLCLGLFLAYQIKGIIIILFIAFIINAGLRPIIANLEKRKIKRPIAILLTYAIAIIAAAVLSFVIINTALVQIKSFLSNIDYKIATLETFVNQHAPFLKGVIDIEAIEKVFESGDIESLTSNQFYSFILQGISAVGGQGIDIISKFAGGIVSLISVIIISIYMLASKRSSYEAIIELTPKKYQKKLFPIFKEIESRLGSWLVGLVVLSVIVGIGTYFIVALPALIDPNYSVIKYAFIIAVIAAALESIPNLGPAITMIITVFIALLSGASVGIIIYIIIAFLILQQIESIFFVPVVMKRAIDLNPILSVVGVLAGFELGGPIAALLAVPVIAITQIILFEISTYWKKNEE